MEIKEITSKEEWEDFLKQCAEKTFLQSWNWAEFNEKMGNSTWRFGIYETDKLLAVAFAYKISARRGTFLFVPHGPVILESLTIKDKKEILGVIVAELAGIAKEEGASFLRISPIFSANAESENIFSDLGFRQSPIHMHPELTWELDLTPPKEELLAGMRKTTRYLIRQAEKNPDIQIEKSEDINDLEKFWPVYSETAKRRHFVVFSKEYLRRELEVFISSKEAIIFLGKHKGQVVSAAILIFWQNSCFYHHSGSLARFNKFPVSYLLQWEVIKEAKKRGCTSYNFWGIAPTRESPKNSAFSAGKIVADRLNKRHPWYGLSLFKIGFGGYSKQYVKAQDYIFSKKYWLVYIIESIRKKKRNL